MSQVEDRVHYDDSLAQRDLPAGFQPLNITIQVKGSYEQNIRFLNAMERQKMMLLVDGVSFSGLKDGELTLAINIAQTANDRTCSEQG